MDLLYAMRDLGVADPAADATGEEAGRAALARAIDAAGGDRRAGASRTSRRRRRRLGLLAGVLSALVAVGVWAVVVVSSGGSGPTGTGSLRVTRPHAPAPGAAQDTAYVVRRVRARLAVVDHNRGVVLSTLNKTGFPIYRDVTYYDPKTQVLYQDDKAYDRHGRELYANVDANIPIKRYMHFRTFWIDYTEHAWAEGESVASEPFQTGPMHFKHPLPAGAMSPPSAVERALSSHIETRAGTSTIDGTRALVLKGMAGQDHITLYVDAQTYQPLRETDHARGKFHTDTITDVLPATAVNIARAKNRPKIPSGYSRKN